MSEDKLIADITLPKQDYEFFKRWNFRDPSLGREYYEDIQRRLLNGEKVVSEEKNNCEFCAAVIDAHGEIYIKDHNGKFHQSCWIVYNSSMESAGGKDE